MDVPRFRIVHVVLVGLLGVVVGFGLSMAVAERNDSDDASDSAPGDSSATVDAVPSSESAAPAADPTTSTTTSTSTTTTTTSTTTAPPPPGLADLADFPIGAAVPGGIGLGGNILDRPDLRELVETEFSEITAENIMKPLYTHPEPGVFNLEQTDALMSWAEESGLAVHGHTLLWDALFNPQVPAWMLNFQGSPDEWRAWTNAYIEELVGTYRGRIVSWDVVNEALNDDGTIRDTIWQRGIGDSYIEEAFVAARAADPDALLYYNDFRFPAFPQKLDGALGMIADFQARDIPIDGIGFQMHILDDFPSDDEILRAFSLAADTGLMVKVTELDVRVNTGRSNQQLDDDGARRQAERYRTVVELYLAAVPPEQRGGITVWGVSDPESYLSTGPDWPLLFDADLQPKPAYSAVEDALITALGN